jgi:hypothetical protein
VATEVVGRPTVAVAAEQPRQSRASLVCASHAQHRTVLVFKCEFERNIFINKLKII